MINILALLQWVVIFICLTWWFPSSFWASPSSFNFGCLSASSVLNYHCDLGIDLVWAPVDWEFALLHGSTHSMCGCYLLWCKLDLYWFLWWHSSRLLNGPHKFWFPIVCWLINFCLSNKSWNGWLQLIHWHNILWMFSFSSWLVLLILGLYSPRSPSMFLKTLTSSSW